MPAFEVIALDTATPQLRAPGAGDTYSLPRTATQSVGTLTSAVPIFHWSATWNNGAAAFTALKLDITDTASDTLSYLLDLRNGGASIMTLRKDGYLRVQGIGAALFGDLGLNYFGSGVMSLLSDSAYIMMGGSGDLRLFRDAANTFAQRNGTNAQEKRLYGTFTDASNYRRLSQGMSTAGVAFLRPEGAGTGASGNVLHISGLPTSNPGPGILWNDAGTVKVGT